MAALIVWTLPTPPPPGATHIPNAIAEPLSDGRIRLRSGDREIEIVVAPETAIVVGDISKMGPLAAMGLVPLYQPPAGIICPYCGSFDSAPWGKNRKGTLRRRCGECQKTYTV